MRGHRRKRKKSSPGQKPFTKKYRFGPIPDHSDSEDSVYFETEGDQLTSLDDTPPPTPPSTSLTLRPYISSLKMLSDADIKQLAMVIAPIVAEEIKKSLLTDIKTELKGLMGHETESLRKEIHSLKATNDKLLEELGSTKLELDELEQYGRRMCLDISGISGDTGKYDENVTDKILSIMSDKGIAISANDIDRCHRRGRPKPNTNRKVIIKFTNSSARQRVYTGRKELGSDIYVQENLTRLREKLSFEARQLVRTKTFTKTWIAGCKVLASLPDESSPIIISSMADIDKFKPTCLPMEQTDDSVTR